MTQQDVDLLTNALRQRFNADVDVQPINGNGRYRFAVVSPQFKQMNQLQRQDAIWEVVDRMLPRDKTLDISLIIAFDPPELA
jgi:stress-induced morphogen